MTLSTAQSRLVPFIPSIAAGVCGAVGGLVLLGWAIDISWLKSPLPESESMKPNSALALIFLGTSLWLSSRSNQTQAGRSVGTGCAMVATGVGVLTILEDVLGWNPGFDQWLFEVPANPLEIGPPGRISLNSALCLFFFGTAVLLNNQRSRASSAIREGLTVAGAVVAFVAVLGYLYDERFLYGIGPYAAMSLPSALTLMVAGIGILLLHPDRGLIAVATGEHAGGDMLRRLLPGALLVLPAIGWVGLWVERRGYYDTALGEVLFATLSTIILCSLLWRTARSLNELDRRRREGEVARRQSEDWLRMAQLSAKVGVWDWQVETDRLSWTTELASLYGLDVSAVQSYQDFRKRVHPDDVEKMEAERETAIRNHQPFHVEFRIVKPSGEVRWVAALGGAVYDDSGRPVRVLGNNIDITERKQAEEALRESRELLRASEARYRMLYDHNPLMYFTLDPEGTVLIVNPTGARNLGYTVADLVGQPVTAVFPAEVHDTVRQQLALCVRNPDQVHTWEITKVRRDGSRLWVRETAVSVPDPNGRPTILIMCEDVTERMRTETALRQSEERFRQVSEHIQEVFWLSDTAKDEILYVSPAYETIWGRSCESLYQSPRSWLEAIHPGDRERVLHAAMTLQVSGAYDEEYRIVRPDGSLRWIRDRAYPVHDKQGRVVRVAGVADDITDRKRAEAALQQVHDELERRIEERTAALRESEARYSSLVSQATDLIYTTGTDGRFTFVNRAVCTIMGYEEQELLGKQYLDLIREDFHQKAQSFYDAQVARRTPSTYMELPVVAKDGRELWLGQRVQLRIIDHQIIGTEAIARDITERKRSEQELRRSQTFITSVVEHLPNMIFVKDAKNLRFVQFNRAGEQLLGYSRSELIGKCDHDFFPLEEAEFFVKKDRDVLESRRLVDIPEEPIQTKLQGVRVLHTKKIPLYDETGQPQYLLGISEDITEAKAAARALEERARCSGFSADVSLKLNQDEPLDRQLQYCTDAAVKHLGVAFTRIWLRGPGDLCPDCHKAEWCRDRTECLHLHASAGLSTNLNGEYRRIPMGALKIGCIAQGAGTLVTNDALQDDRLPDKTWMQENGLHAFGGFPLIVGGQVVGVLALFGRDAISESMRQTLESVCNSLAAAIARKRAETALQLAYERLRTVTRQLSEAEEAERGRIARELHDEFGQALTSLKFDVAWIKKKLSRMTRAADRAAIEAKATLMSESVDGLIQSVRAAAAALRPGLLDDLGPVAAVDWLVASFRERTGLPCEFIADPALRDKALHPELATAVFRCSQELLTNVMRHAEASSVSVSLTADGDQVRLTVRDNGRGIEERDWQRAHSLGLRGLRERVQLLGGRIDISGVPDKGTEVRVALPLSADVMPSGDIAS